MLILNFLVRRRTQREIARLASDVARRSRLAVWERVYHDLGHMNVPEARGYIRARSADLLQQEADAVIERHPEWSDESCQDLLAQAKDKIVHLIVGDMLKLGQNHFEAVRRAA